MSLNEYKKTYYRYLGLELKRNYQYNMLKSMLIVYGTIFIATTLFILLQKKVTEKPAIPFDIVNVTDINNSGGNQKQLMEKSISNIAQGSMKLFLPDDFPNGYMPNIKIVRDFALPTITTSISVPNDVYEPNIENTLFTETNIHSDEKENNNGNGAGYGDDDDWGLPTENPYIPNIRSIQPTDNFNIKMLKEKGLVMLADIRWPYTAPKTDTGYVVIIINIDKKGRIDWELISEEPANKGFANVLIEALKRSKFNPPLNENGEKSPIRVMLASTICYDCPSSTIAKFGKMEVIQLNQY